MVLFDMHEICRIFVSVKINNSHQVCVCVCCAVDSPARIRLFIMEAQITLICLVTQTLI